YQDAECNENVKSRSPHQPRCASLHLLRRNALSARGALFVRARRVCASDTVRRRYRGDCNPVGRCWLAVVRTRVEAFFLQSTKWGRVKHFCGRASARLLQLAAELHLESK